MKITRLLVTFAAGVLLFNASDAFATGFKADSTKVVAENSKTGGKVGNSAIKLLDINSANKSELVKLPGITPADADKIIAGRPYLSKANLVTESVIPEGTYYSIKSRIVARQKKGAVLIKKEQK